MKKGRRRERRWRRCSGGGEGGGEGTVEAVVGRPALRMASGARAYDGDASEHSTHSRLHGGRLRYLRGSIQFIAHQHRLFICFYLIFIRFILLSPFTPPLLAKPPPLALSLPQFLPRKKLVPHSPAVAAFRLHGVGREARIM